MAAINFYVYDGSDFSVNLSGSGIGAFSSAGFGQSVEVGDYNDLLFVTDSNGLEQGSQVYTVKYTHPNSGLVQGDSESLNLLAIPNYQAPINIRFTHDTDINVQNARLYCYDRDLINPPSGVTVKMAEIIHPNTAQDLSGSGDHTWYTTSAPGSYLPLAESPGASGLYAASGTGSTELGLSHDWYVVYSCSPDTGSSKYFSAYCQFEYL
jgi:hypothetical protein